ncbi:MAG: acyl carrier protein [Bacteroidetes bacterium]|nr:MAG: acyl carrier protein [Bacteroidota bacterium]
MQWLFQKKTSTKFTEKKMDKLMADLKKQIIAQLNLKDLKPEDIGDDQPLFVEGLGLDSIDALELIVLLQQEYHIKLSNADDGPKAFKSVRTMAEYITTHQGQKTPK